MTDEQNELAREKYLTFIYVKARNSRGQLLKQTQANTSLIEDAHMPLELFLEAVKQEKFASQFIWEEPRASKSDPKILEKDRETLAQAARANRNFSGVSEANLALCRDVLGAGFTEDAVIHGFRTRRLILAAPTDEERQQWQELDLDAEKLRLSRTPAHLLKQEAAQGILDRRRQAQVEEADRAFAAKQELEVGISYPPLPEFLPEFLAKRFGNQRLDRSFLVKKADRDAYRFLHQKFGVVAVEERLRGIR